MKKFRLFMVMAMTIAITLGGFLATDSAQAQNWSQITVQNNYDTSVRFILDGNVMDDIGPGFFRTYQVKPGAHLLEAVTADGKKLSRSADIAPGASPTWTLMVNWN